MVNTNPLPRISRINSKVIRNGTRSFNGEKNSRVIAG